MITLCLYTAAQCVHLTPTVFLCMWQKTLPAGLSGRCAPVPTSSCNWSRRFSVMHFIDFSWTLFYPEVGGNLFLQSTGSYPRDCTLNLSMLNRFLLFYISHTRNILGSFNCTRVCNPCRTVHILHWRFCTFAFCIGVPMHEHLR